VDESQITTNDQGAQPLPSAVAVEPRYKGVGGWLFFLCLNLTVLFPLRTLGSLADSFGKSSRYFDRFPGLRAIALIDALLSVGLIAFSIYAGVGLWSIRRGAVRTAKRYFQCYLGYAFIAAALPFMAGLPSAANDSLIFAAVKSAGGGLVSFSIWNSYLNKSERVKATYES
jgi:hypothetical protein